MRHGSAIWRATVLGSAQQSGTGRLTLCVDASQLQYHTGKVFRGPSSLGLVRPWGFDRVPAADGFPAPLRRVRAEGMRSSLRFYAFLVGAIRCPPAEEGRAS